MANLTTVETAGALQVTAHPHLTTQVMPLAFAPNVVVPPVISNVTPATGTAIAPTDSLGFDVTDPEGFRLIMLVADFPAIGIREVIHDGLTFSANYSGSANSRVAITNGFQYTILRTGGWPVSPRIIPYAIDVTGAENA